MRKILDGLFRFTQQNIMFFLALTAFFFLLFELFGGWEVVGVKFWQSLAAWIFWGLGTFFFLYIIARGFWWWFVEKMKTEKSGVEKKIEKLETLNNKIDNLENKLDKLLQNIKK